MEETDSISSNDAENVDPKTIIAPLLPKRLRIDEYISVRSADELYDVYGEILAAGDDKELRTRIIDRMLTIGPKDIRKFPSYDKEMGKKIRDEKNITNPTHAHPIEGKACRYCKKVGTVITGGDAIVARADEPSFVHFSCSACKRKWIE